MLFHVNAPTPPESPALLLFMDTWPTILKSWGLSKTAARIHAFLLSKGEAQSQDDIIDGLDISRGGTSTQLGILEEAGLVERLRILGHRNDRFRAIDDPNALFHALQVRHFQQTLRPLQEMSQSLGAIASQQDLQWLEPVQGLGKHLKTQLVITKHLSDS